MTVTRPDVTPAAARIRRYRARLRSARVGLPRREVEMLARRVLSTNRVSEAGGFMLAQAVVALLRRQPHLETIEL